MVSSFGFRGVVLGFGDKYGDTVLSFGDRVEVYMELN
jgi:hypothetical protein